MPQSPFVRTEKVATAGAAAAADESVQVMECPYDLTVTSVTYTPEADINTTDTESRTYTLYNRGSDGNGTTKIAELALVAAVADFVNDDEREITLSGTAANLDCAEGDILEWVSLHVGSTGLADPGGLVQVSFTRQD